MFNKKETKDVIVRQSERIIELEEENLKLILEIGDSQENTLLILDYIQYMLERNNYNNEELQRKATIRHIEDIKSNIEEKGLENINELAEIAINN